MELDGLTTADYDRIVLSTAGKVATVDGGAVELDILDPTPGIYSVGDVFDLIVADTVTINTLPTLTIDASDVSAGFAGTLSFANTGGSLGAGQESLRLTLTDVPDLGIILGDWDFSGEVQNLDIQAMLDALVDLDGYKAEHGLDDEELKQVGDLNMDDAVTNADIQAMLDYLTGGGGLAEIQALSLEVFGDANYLDGYVSAVPEPTTLALAGLAGVGLFKRRRAML
jgi:hypothetical protein